MEPLKQTEKFITPKEDAGLKDNVSSLFAYLKKQVMWIENIYSNITKRVNWGVDRLNRGDGVSGTFMTTDGKTITVENGVITKIE
jgi:hypothetical protein